jgi:hypothetical protein
MSEAQAIAHNEVTKDTGIGGGSAAIFVSALTLICYLRWRRRKSKSVMQKVEKSNKVNAERGETPESSAQNGSTKMLPVDAAAHDAKIEDAILHIPEDVNEEAENATGKKEVVKVQGKKCEEKCVFLFFFIFMGCFPFFGGMYLLVQAILFSTDAYVCGCGCSSDGKSIPLPPA